MSIGVIGQSGGLVQLLVVVAEVPAGHRYPVGAMVGEGGVLAAVVVVVLACTPNVAFARIGLDSAQQFCAMGHGTSYKGPPFCPLGEY